MFNRFVPAALVVMVLGGFVIAETYNGIVTKIEDKKLTLKTFGKKKGEKGTEKELTINDKTKFTTGEGDDAKTLTLEEAKKFLTGGAKKGGKKEGKKDGKGKGKGRVGKFAKVTTTGTGDDEVVTTVEFKQFKGGKKKEKKKAPKKDD